MACARLVTFHAVGRSKAVVGSRGAGALGCIADRLDMDRSMIS
jgi:hypothetical protein